MNLGVWKLPTLIVFSPAKNCRPTANLITRMVGKFLPTYIFPNSEGCRQHTMVISLDPLQRPWFCCAFKKCSSLVSLIFLQNNDDDDDDDDDDDKLLRVYAYFPSGPLSKVLTITKFWHAQKFAHDLSSGFFKWSCKVVIKTTPQLNQWHSLAHINNSPVSSGCKGRGAGLKLLTQPFRRPLPLPRPRLITVPEAILLPHITFLQNIIFITSLFPCFSKNRIDWITINFKQ